MDDTKFEHNKFMRFQMKIQTIMSSIKGIRSITLDYLLRPDESQPEEVIEKARPNVQSDDFVKANATLSGAEYNQDNKILYTILQLHLTDTSGWNVISRFAKEKDGRSAYLALRSRYESPAYKDSEKARATQILTQSLSGNTPCGRIV